MPGSADAPDHPDPPTPAARRHRFPPAAIGELNALIALIEEAYAQRLIDEEGRKKLYGPYLRLKQRHGGRSAFQLDDPVGLTDLAQTNRIVQRMLLELAPGLADRLRRRGLRPSR